MKTQENPEICGALCLKRDDASFHVTIFVLSKRKQVSKVRKKHCRTHAGGSSKDWSRKSNWQRSAVEDAGQSSQDMWKSSKPRAKWKDIFHNMEELGTLVKEKKTQGLKFARKVRKEKPRYTQCRKLWLTTPKLKTVTKADSGKL